MTPVPEHADPNALATLRWTVVQGVVSIVTVLLGIGAAVFGWYQYRESLRRDRIKATNDAIVEAAQLDVEYSALLRRPDLKAEPNGRHYLACVERIFAGPISAAEQAQLNVFWDTGTRVNNFFAGAIESIDSKYFDEQLFFDRLATFTLVAFAIVYPAYAWLCRKKGFDAGCFREAAKRAQDSLLRKGIRNEFSLLNLNEAPYCDRPSVS